MKRLSIQTFKIMIIAIVSIIVLLVIIAAIFINVSPEFGAKASAEEIKKYEALSNFEKGQFINLIPTSMDMSAGNMASTFREYFRGGKERRPDFDIPVQSIDSLEIVENKEQTKLIWFGHSAFLLQIDGKNILIDPMFGEVPAPHPWLGGKRYSNKLPISIEKLPEIDAIIISHDHYDHLDYGSIEQLKRKTKEFFVPIGVGRHFRSWGIPEQHIHELNWWEEVQFNELTFIFAPSRHFSGRGISDRNKTLWGSWVILGKKDKIYFSGDGGYGPHFKEIGDKFGPFDFAMIECGQYNEKWAQIHMMPEESAQAAVDVKANMMMPIHWGAFTLALHSWTDPVERVIKKTNELGMPLLVPIIGERIVLDSNLKVSEQKWWLKK